jgi:hypothetical protein
MTVAYPHFRMLDNSGINFHVAWEWKSYGEATECAQGYRKDGYFAKNVAVKIGKRIYWVTYIRRNPKVRRT